MVSRWGPPPWGPPSSRQCPARATDPPVGVQAGRRCRTCAAGRQPAAAARQHVRGAVVLWKRERPRAPRGHVGGCSEDTPCHRQPSSVAVSVGRRTARRVGHEGPNTGPAHCWSAHRRDDSSAPHHTPSQGPPGLPSSSADRPPRGIGRASQIAESMGPPTAAQRCGARGTHLRGMSHNPCKRAPLKDGDGGAGGAAATATSGAARDGADEPIGVPPLTAKAIIGSATDDDGGRFSEVWAVGASALPQGVAHHRHGPPPHGWEFGWGFGWRWTGRRGCVSRVGPPPTSRKGTRVLHRRVVRGRHGAAGGCAACWRECHPHNRIRGSVEATGVGRSERCPAVVASRSHQGGGQDESRRGTTHLAESTAALGRWATAQMDSAARDPGNRCSLIARVGLTHNESCIAVFPFLADPVDVKKGDQLCDTVSQPSIQPDKVDPPMGS